MSIDSKTTELWRQLCIDYYTSFTNDAKERQSLRYLEWFDRLAPRKDPSSVTINILGDGINNQHMNQINQKLGINMEDLIQKNESLWYFLDDIRNQARQEAHNRLMMQRKQTCLTLLHSTQQIIESDIANGRVQLHSHILIHLKLLLDKAMTDPALLPSVVGGIYNWIRLQTLDNNYCLSWKFDLDMLFEREAAIQSCFGLVVFSLGRNFNDDDSESPNLVIRQEISNPFLHRLRRMIEKCCWKVSMPAAKITRNISTVTASLIQRTNALGEQDDVSTKLANIILPCPIL